MNCKASPVVNLRNPCNETSSLDKNNLRIATWNVRSMYEDGKIYNATREMRRLGVSILGVSEMRWPGSGGCEIGDHYLYYSGNDDPKHYNGVAVVLDKNIKHAVKAFIPVSDRVMLLKINASPFNINIIQTYAPTCDGNDGDVEAFYDDIGKCLKLSRNHEITIVMGDFNAKIGQGKCENVVGEHGLGKRNERGERLIQFAQEHELIVTNTFFKLHPRRLYTWKSNAENENRIIRNQIDFVMINQRFRNSVKSVKTYPGADLASDHNPLVATVQLRLKRLQKTPMTPKINLDKLKDDAVKEEIIQELNANISNKTKPMVTPEDEWQHIKRTFQDVTNKLKDTTQKKKKPWMTEEILQLMDERRKVKTRNKQKYIELHRTIRKKIRETKAKFLDEECKEIEQLQAKHDTFNLHKKVKEAAGTYRKQHTGNLCDSDGQIIFDPVEKLKSWKDYISTLYHDDRGMITTDRNKAEGPVIIREEVEYALKNTKNRKATGPDEIPVEILKLLKDQKALDVLVELFNLIYITGTIPKDWLRSTIIPLPKKSSPKSHNDYRTIALMSHTLKVFLKIIHARIYKKCEEQIGETQFGFRNGLGTREALMGMHVLVQRCLDISVDVYACFIDYEKAFDCVKHEKLITILTNIGLDSRDIRIIENLYWEQTASIKVGNSSSEDIEIKKGVRQGCILSPILFNLYSEKIFNEALDEKTEGIIVNGQVINNLRYADDTVLLATSEVELQSLIDSINQRSLEAGLRLNVKKTKVMVISRKNSPKTNLTANGIRLQQVDSYKYLGSTIDCKGDNSVEIRARIEQARTAFRKMSKVLSCKNFSLNLRLRLLRCYVFSVLLYGSEAWTLTTCSAKKIEAFEMWCYRRLLRIPWTDKVRNITVRERLGKDREIMYEIKKRKLEYLGHIMRNTKYRVLQNILQGKVEGKRGPGRRRHSWLKNLREWFGVNTCTLFRRAVSKVQIALMIANVRVGQGP